MTLSDISLPFGFAWFVMETFRIIAVVKEDRKRKGSSPMPTESKTQSAKKKQPDEKKTGFERGLEPEKILGRFRLLSVYFC